MANEIHSIKIGQVKYPIYGEGLLLSDIEGVYYDSYVQHVLVTDKKTGNAKAGVSYLKIHGNDNTNHPELVMSGDINVKQDLYVNGTITGNLIGNATSATSAGKATKLATKRSLWGNDFDGTANVDGAITIKNGANLTLQSPSDTQTDPGDIIFAGFGGDELCRLYKDPHDSKMLMRFGETGTSYTMLHSGNSYINNENRTVTINNQSIVIPGEAGTVTIPTHYGLTLQSGAFTPVTYNPTGAPATVNIPTSISHLTGGTINGNLTATGALTTNNFLKITAPASDGTPTRNAAIIRTEVASSDANKALVHIGSNYGYISVNENNTAKPSAHVDAIGIYRGVIGVGGTFTYDTLKSNQSNNISLEAVGNVKALSFIENGQSLSAKYQPKGDYLTSQDHYKNSVTNTNGAAQSPVNGGTFTIPNITVNANGHVTNLGTTTVTLPSINIPTSLPASDVYAWAKAATKPSYTASEVGALSTNGTAADSAKLGGKTAAQFAHVGRYPKTSTNNWHLQSGIYIVDSNSDGLPLPSNGHNVIHCNWDQNAANQLFLAYDRDAAYFRRKMSNEWKDWKQLAFTSDIPTSLPASDVYAWAKAATKPSYTASEVGALSTNGGTLTGNLTVSGTANSITTPTFVVSGSAHSATLTMENSSLKIDKELQLTAGGSADICSGIACALKADRLQVKNLISENIILGNSANGSFSNMSFNIKKYGSIASQAPASLTTLLTVNTTGNVGIGVANPSEKLEVNGNAKIGGDFVAAGKENHHVYVDNGSNQLGMYVHADAGGGSYTQLYTYVDGEGTDLTVGYDEVTITTSLRVFEDVHAYSFYQNSDERLKTFGDKFEVDFEKLAKLRKSYFTFNNTPDKTHIGVSAQEVQKICPEIVNTDKDGYLSVDYSKLSVVALTAVDELYKKNIELENRLAKIETMLAKINIE